MPSLLDPVRRRSETSPTSVVLRHPGGEWTYRQLLDASTALGARLRASGMAPGDRVVLIAPAVPEFVVAYLGIQAAGCVVVPMNTMSRDSEIGYVIEDAGAASVVVWHKLSAPARQAAAVHGLPVQDLLPMRADEVAAVDDAVEERGLTDTAAILYTSGTTGRPKGAELTVGNILDAADISVELRGSGPADRFATALPLFHIYGQITVMMAALAAGASISLLTPFDPVRLLELIRRDRITLVAGVPTMWHAMLRVSDGFGPEDLSTVRIAVSGGASLPGQVWQGIAERLGCEVLEGYGLTETTSIATFSRPGEAVRIGWVGRAAPRTEIEVRDADGSPVAAGEVGEVWVRGPSVMKGYWNRPEATEGVLRDGWFRTGDLGLLDGEGHLRIVDRLKDLIIRGGYNVYPGEVEEVLYQHPEIVEAAVVGVADDYYGEEVAAMVVLAPGSRLRPEEVTSWARERLSPYKIPRLVHAVAELPKSATGKILKREIEVPARTKTEPTT